MIEKYAGGDSKREKYKYRVLTHSFPPEISWVIEIQCKRI